MALPQDARKPTKTMLLLVGVSFASLAFFSAWRIIAAAAAAAFLSRRRRYRSEGGSAIFRLSRWIRTKSLFSDIADFVEAPTMTLTGFLGGSLH